MKFAVLTASAALLLSGVAANAAISYNSDDLVVAFSSNSTLPHTGNTYLVDFGNLSQFNTGGSFADGNLHTVNVGQGTQFLSDLTSAGITNLATATFSIQGADFESGFSNVSLSKAESTKGVGSNPYARGSTDVANSDMLNLIFSLGSSAASSTAANSFIQNTSDSNSYGKYIFGSSSPGQAYETYSNPEGGLNQVIDLYAIANNQTGAAQRVGAFDFNTSTGLLRFSSDITDFAPVPEPSTFGFAAALVGLCAFARTRRAQARA